MTLQVDQQRDTLFYDGACRLCIRSTWLLRRFDWLGRLHFQDFTEIDDAALPVSRDLAMQGIPMLTRSGRVLVGHAAMRRALVQTPGLPPCTGAVRAGDKPCQCGNLPCCCIQKIAVAALHTRVDIILIHHCLVRAIRDEPPHIAR